jgi:hypothetical protein
MRCSHFDHHIHIKNVVEGVYYDELITPVVLDIKRTFGEGVSIAWCGSFKDEVHLRVYARG